LIGDDQVCCSILVLEPEPFRTIFLNARPCHVLCMR
jgi:hypothetical protein